MRLFTLLALCLLSSASYAGEINKSFFGGVAIDGYDSVAYFNNGSFAKGDKVHTFEWKQAEWRFADAKSLRLFASAPDKYAPQYGGHCANAMSLDKKVGADSEIWLIHSGRLFLFYAEEGRERWQSPSEDIESLIMTADSNWQRLKDK